MKNAWFWIAFAVLLPQALWLRKTAPRFSPAGGPRNGSVGSGKQLSLLAIGDSIIAGVGASRLDKALVGRTATTLAAAKDCGVSWTAIGESGYTSEKVLTRLLPRLPSDAVDYMIVSVGVNDVTGLSSARTWRRNLSSLLEKLSAHSPNATIAVAGMPPLHEFPLLPQPLRAVFGMRGKSFDEIMSQVTQHQQNCLHAPLRFDFDPQKFSGDGYHPSEQGYAEFGRHLAEEILGYENSHREL